MRDEVVVKVTASILASSRGAAAECSLAGTMLTAGK